MKKTPMIKPSQVKREWHLIDAKDKVLGRLATQIVTLLMGKHKPEYTPHIDCGDWVVVINCRQVRVTGKKRKRKKYYRHSGYPGGLKELTFAQLMERDPCRVVHLAVARMLPRNKLASRRLARLRLFADKEHPFGDKIGKEEE